MTRLAVPLAAFAAFAVLAYAPAPAPTDTPARDLAPADTEWAWPEHAENLQVLPADIGADGLRDVMRGFTRSLGVRCGFCHVGEGDFLEWDFASDENHHKEVARQMMRMTQGINADWLADMEHLHVDIDAANPATFAVTCWTCHRGSSEPERVPPPHEEGGAPPAPGAPPAGHEHPPGQGHDHGAPPAGAPPADTSHGTTHTHGDGTQHRHDD